MGDVFCKRGSIYWCKIPTIKSQGSVQTGDRPCLVVQNDLGNKHSPTTVVVPVTKELKKCDLPMHVTLKAEDYEDSLLVDNMVLCEQIRVISKEALGNKMFSLNSEDMKRVNEALKVSVGI